MGDSKPRPKVRIKGVKEGLHFMLDDLCDWDTVLDELEYKLQKTHQTILYGPMTHVFVKCGHRELNEQMKLQIQSIIKKQGNLLIKSIQSEIKDSAEQEPEIPKIQIGKGVIRSGQILQFENDILFLGDINPGGTIICNHNIYVMGALRGSAHAGINGDESAIIVASLFQPTQLRIANIISRPPDFWESKDYGAEFAYIKEGQMQIEQLHQLHRIIPDCYERV